MRFPIPSRLLLSLALAALLPAEIIDRIAVTVDNQVITQSEIFEDIRIAAFLDGQKPDFSPASRRQAARRLIERALMRREMDLTRYPEPSQEDVNKMLAAIETARFGNEQKFREALREYHLTQPELERYLRRQAAVLQFIEYRFRPEVLVSDAEVRACYENQVLPAYRARNAAEPSYEDARAQCEKSIAAKRVDQLVDQWIKQARARANIVYQEDAFR